VRLGLGGGPTLGVRLVLVVLLAFSGGVVDDAQAIWPFDRVFGRAPLAERASELLADAIRTPTFNPPGNERTLARKLAAALGRAGIENRVIATPSPDGGPMRAAVWGRLRANRGDRAHTQADKRPALALLSHLDTVPADAREWSVDPYAGEIWDGFVWGRGALDAKGIAVSHLMSLIEIAESGIDLQRDLVFLATPEEETGGKLGAGWLVQNHPELVEGVGYLLTEGGGIQLSRERDGDRQPIWGVALTEKAPCWLELRARGRAGHSSAPTPDAAVPRLIAALDRIRRAESPVRVTPVVDRMFRALAPVASDWDRAGFEDLAVTLEANEGFRRRFLGNPGQNALVRNTVSITVLEGAPKTNVAPGVARAQLDARLLPGESCDSFAQALTDLIDDTSIEISELLSFPARASTPHSPLFRAIEEVAARQPTPGLVVPRMIGGFTDAHWFRELGIVAYGFVPRALTADEARRVHGPDERVSIETLTESIRLTIDLVRTFDAIEAAE
jgi:acetylornithine deacetylase/succinyl-diaminopimelate desuccinylase-like protein